MAKTKQDRKYMELAIEQMRLSRSEHREKPDPLVGTVLVDSAGNLLGAARRSKFEEGDHGEFSVLEKVRPDICPSGCTIYVTLEPCVKRNDPKKPCAERILEKQIKRVVIGMLDPNPDIYRRGVELLTRSGIEVDFFDSELMEEIKRENDAFIKYFENFEYFKGNESGPKEVASFGGASREEDIPVYRANLNDLSNDAILEYLHRSGLSYELGSPELWEHFWKAGLLVKEPQGERIYPTLAGLVLFGTDPSLCLPQCRVTAQCYLGTLDHGLDPDNLAAEGYKEITGPLLYAVDGTLKFFRQHVKFVTRIVGSRRMQVPEYPEKAIREAIVNALVHRDYKAGAHTIFRMFRDRIVVRNIGIPLRPITLEDLRSSRAVSLRRNPRIAAVARRLDLMEEEAWGIPNMKKWLLEYRLKGLEIEYDAGHFMLTLYGREATPVEFRISSEILKELNPRQRQLIVHIQQHRRISAREYMNSFGVLTRETANQDFKKLISLGLIERKGGGRGTYYVLVEF